MFIKPKVNSGLVAAASITILRELIGDDNGRVGVLTKAYTNTLEGNYHSTGYIVYS